MDHPNFRVRWARALPLVLLAAGVHAEPSRIRLIDTASATGPLVEVTGEWSSGCPPLLQKLEAHGRELTVVAQPDSARCSGLPGPYRLVAPLPDRYKSAADGEILRLRYLLRDDPLSAPRLMAFELVETGTAAAARPETGFWWSEAGGEFDHAGPGIGAQLESQGKTLALTFSGYTDSGAPEWMFGATTLAGQTSDLPLNGFLGGRGPFGGYLGPSEALAKGRLQIEWLSSARAVFWFSRPDAQQRGIELQPVSMVRFDFGREPGSGWIGRWLLEDGSSEGLRLLEFSELVERETDFTLLGESGLALHCQRSAKRPSSPPLHCELQLADARMLRLDDVGLSRLRGRDDAGGSVQLSLLAP